MNEINLTFEDLKEIAERREKENEFYNFYVSDYLANGEGRTIWIMIDSNHDREKSLQDMKEFVCVDKQAIVEYTKEDFFRWYNHLLPDAIKHKIENKNHPNIYFKQQFHFNYN